jgi:hypothetical protein
MHKSLSTIRGGSASRLVYKLRGIFLKFTDTRGVAGIDKLHFLLLISSIFIARDALEHIKWIAEKEILIY